jgi:hypothetical protein
VLRGKGVWIDRECPLSFEWHAPPDRGDSREFIRRAAVGLPAGSLEAGTGSGVVRGGVGDRRQRIDVPRLNLLAIAEEGERHGCAVLASV